MTMNNSALSTLGILALSLIAARLPHEAAALSHHMPNTKKELSRRDVLIGAASTAAISSIGNDQPAVAAPLEAETVDLAAFNAARASTTTSGGSGGNPSKSIPNIPGSNSDNRAKRKKQHVILPSVDPSPLLPLRGGKNGKSTVPIPRVGYSLYKTPPEAAPRCAALALRCGVRHFDVGSLYGSNAEVAPPFKSYLDNGIAGLTNNRVGYSYKEEKPELLEFMDGISAAGERHAATTMGIRSKSIGPPLDGSAGRRARRDQLFVSHKLSNAEQSTNILAVKRSVKAAIAELGVGYLDLVSIHSPLTDEGRRLATYQALIELRDSGFVRSVGVCNYGLSPLEEIAAMVGDDYNNLPAINQIELSPFNQHRDVVQYCDENGIAVGCSAWSKLSGADGPSEGWAVVADIAKVKGVTKAQVLVRWSLQSGYVCVPRSGCGSKLERVAIAENSYGGVNSGGASSSFVLSSEEMKMLDGLDVGYKAGKLGRRDGWGDGDVTGPDWDPTEIEV